MQIVNYEKYQRKWTPRSTIILAVVESLITGFFLGSSLIEAVAGHNVWRWVSPLTFGFASGVGALQATLIALHNCPTSIRPQDN